MLRILSSKRYWSLIGKIADDQETIKGQASVINAQQKRIEDQQKTIEYLNEIIFKRDRMIQQLERAMKRSNIPVVEFPETSKIECLDINQILKQ